MKSSFCGFADSSHLVAIIYFALGIFACQRLTHGRESASEQVGWILSIKL